MIKALVVYALSFILLFALVHLSQEAILNQLNLEIRFNCWDTNLFFALASFIICVHFQFFSSIKSLEPQLGFIYLPTLFIKGIVFFFAFKSSVFSIDLLTTTERLSLLIPLLVFLGLEVLFVVKIIRKTQG
jgi:hypothetical protein